MIGRLPVAAALLIAAPAFGQTAPAPSAEAEALGRELAANGAFVAIMTMVPRDVDTLISEHPELNDAAKTKLRTSAAATVQKVLEVGKTAIGHQYALTMSIDDLRAALAFTKTPAAQAWRAAEPAAAMAAVQALDGIDIKRAIWTDYCATPGALCKPATAK